MDQSLKQRLVGAIVLVSLAVIFLPLVFDGQQQQVNSEDYVYPEQPAMTIQSTDFAAIEDEAGRALGEVEQVETAKQEQEQRAAEQYAQDQKQEHTASGEQAGLEADADVEPAQEKPATVEQYIADEQAADQAIEESTSNTVLLADAWMLQVGAFTSPANANGLRDKLIAADYKAYTKQVGGLHKVYVGPEIRRHRLEQQKSALEREFKVKTLILKYIP